MLKRFRNLRRSGILSINQRNADFVLRYNQRRLYPIVDDKLKTKRLALAAGISVPELYTVIETEHDAKYIGEILKSRTDFVVKPAHGSGGDGILVITDRIRDRYRKSNGALLTQDDLAYHLSRILSGAYSLGGHPDVALIEYRVTVDAVFAPISYEGVPDIRIITFLGYPAMAMLRLPTRMSDGKANLHQGAVGVGIDLATGVTLGGVWHNEPIDYHPDTLHSIVGVTLPHWDAMLQLAARCYELTGLGYIGVDLVIDKIQGPLMLELNARPGLSIQIANREGALERYRIIEKAASQARNPRERVSFSQSQFGNPLL